jgi:hypothetical protein
MTMGSFWCLPARGAFLRSSSLLHFLSSRTDECTGNGGPGSIEYSATTGRLGLSLLGLEVEALGSGALWHATTTINSSLALGDDGFGPKRLATSSIASILGTTAATLWSTALARDVGGSKIPAERLGTNLRAHTRARARLPGQFPLRKHPRNRSSSTKRDIPTSFEPDSCCSCCRAGCLTLSLAALGGISERILIIFFVSNPTKVDH